MAHFAEIGKVIKTSIGSGRIVKRVLVVPNEQENRAQDFLSKDLGLGGTWVQTSYNNNIRKNFAGTGYIYDSQRDAFIAPEPQGHIGFDEETCRWMMPEQDKHKIG